jgi:ketosteroid isomerase-like protein
MSEDALTVARRAWDYWVAEDLEGFLSCWAPDGVWTMQGHSKISGSSRGVDAIAKTAQLAFELSGGTLKARPLELVAASDDSVLGYFHMDGSRPGITLDQDGIQRMVIRDGKLVSLHNFWADIDQVDAFFD